MEEEYILRGEKLQENYPNESLGIQFYKSLLKFENAPALIDGISNNRVTYNELLQNSCCLAETLKAKGHTKGTVIGICSENSVYYPVPLLAALYLGCTVTTYNPKYTTGELVHLCNISKPSVIFCSSAASNTLLKTRTQMRYVADIVVIDSEKNLNGANSMNNYIPKRIRRGTDPLKFKPVDVNPYDDIAFILYSSGTTGLPKGVMLTHRNITSNLAIFRNHLYYPAGRTIQESNITVLPILHIHGLTYFLLNLVAGYTSITFNKFDQVQYLKAVQKYKVSRLNVVPPLAIALAKQAPEFQNFDLSSVEHIVSRSAPLTVDVEDDLKRKFPNLKHFHQMYGCTEGMALTAFTVGDGKTKSCGKVLPNTSAKVINQEGMPLPPHQIGELCFKGDSIMKGYLGDSKSTNLVLNRNGWFSTGDIGYYDKDGYFYIVDRIKEIIKYKAYQVSPSEVENVLLSHPNIVDAAVVGLPHEINGELPCAFVVKNKQTLSEEEIKKFVEERLSPEKWLRGGVRFISAIPKSESGKISRKHLKEQLKPKSKL